MASSFLLAQLFLIQQVTAPNAVPLVGAYQHQHIVVVVAGRNYWVHRLPSLVFTIADNIDLLSGFDRLLGYQLWIVDSNCRLD